MRSSRRVPRTLPLALLAALLAVAACASPKGGSTVTILDREKKEGEIVKPGKTEAEEKEEAEGPCKHVWLQVGWHVTESPEEGPGMTQICMVTQCPRCREVRHECTRRKRKR